MFQSTCKICNQVVKSPLREGSKDVFKDWDNDLKTHIENCIATIKSELEMVRKDRDATREISQRRGLENARLREVLKAVTKLKPRWDNKGEFYKPSDVTPVVKQAIVLLGGSEEKVAAKSVSDEEKVKAILDGLVKEYGIETFVSSGYAYYEAAVSAFTELLKSVRNGRTVV